MSLIICRNLSWILFAFLFLSSQGAAAFGQELDELPKQRSLSYSFNDASITNIERYLRAVGIRLPFQIEGNISGWIWTQNKGSIFSLSDYIAEAKISSDKLDIEGQPIEQAELRLSYADGGWILKSISGNLIGQRADGQPASILKFAGEGIVPAGQSSKSEFTLNVNEVLIVELARSVGFAVESIVQNGIGKASLNASVQRDQLSDLSKWTVRGNVQIVSLMLSGLKKIRLHSALEIDDQVLKLNDATIRSDSDEKLEFDTRLELKGDGQFAFRMKRQSFDWKEILSNEVLSQLRDIELFETEIRVDADGQIKNLQWQANIEAVAKELTYQQYQFESVSLSGPISQDKIGALKLSAEIGDGKIAAMFSSDQYATPTQTSNASVQISSVSLTSVLISSLPFQASQTNRLSAEGSFHWLGWYPNTPLSLAAEVTGSLQETPLQGFARPIEFSIFHKPNDRYQFKASTIEQPRYLVLDGNADWQRWDTFDYQVDAQFSRLEIGLAELSPRIQLPDGLDNSIMASGKATISGDEKEPFSKADFELNYVLGVYRDRKLGIKDFAGHYTKASIQVEALTAFLGNNSATLNGEYRLDGENKHFANLELLDWPLNDLLDIVGGPVPVNEIGGRVSARLRVEADANAATASAWQADGVLAIDDLVQNNRPIGSLRSQIETNHDRVRIRSIGNLFDGQLDSTVRFERGKNRLDYPILGRVVLTDTSIAKLVSIWQPMANAELFDGKSTGRIDFGFDPSYNVHGNITLDINGVTLAGESLIDDTKISGTFNNDRLTIGDFDTRFAGGRVRGRGVANFESSTSFEGTLQLDRVALSRAASLLDLELATSLAGEVSGRGSVKFQGSQANLRGDIKGRDLQLFDISLQDASAQVTSSYRTSSGMIQTKLKHIDGHVLGGRLSGNVDLDYARCLGFDATLKVSEGHVERFEDWLDTGEFFGQGLFDAQVNLQSNCYRGLSDLDGRLAMEFGKTDARSVPLLGPLAQAIPAIGLPQTTFDQGSLDGIITAGQLRIQNSLLYNPRLWISAAGTVGLSDQRLDLQTTVYTGSSADSQLLGSLFQTLALVPDPTIQTINAISNAVSNRTVFLEVRGTAKSPIVRLQTGRTVSRYVIDSLVRQFTAGAIAGGVSAGTAK